MMLEDEAEEISDAELSTSSNDNPRPWLRGAATQPRDHDREAVLPFVADALKIASENEWDDAEMAKLAVLFIKTLKLQHRAAWSFLNRHCAGMATPAFLSKLKDEGLRTTAENVLTILQMSRCSLDKLVADISECVEEHVLSLHDEDTLNLLAAVGQDSMTEEQRVGYIARLCEHCNTKKRAGKVVNAFIKPLPLEDAVSLVHEVVELDFFLDLKGKLKSFFKQFGDRRQAVEERVQAIANSEGVALDASEDEDQDGNLIGFVVDDDEPLIEDSSDPDELPVESRKRPKKGSKKATSKEKKKQRRLEEEEEEEEEEDEEAEKANKRTRASATTKGRVRRRRIIAPDDDDDDDDDA